jgi:uncharacterized protein (DUF362 family)
MKANKVYLTQNRNDLGEALRSSMEYIGLLGNIVSNTRIAIKPNLTYPYYKPGVTTSPTVLKEVVRILQEKTQHIAIVESDGGYGAWDASEAFAGHGLYDMAEELGIQIVNLSQEERQYIEVSDGYRKDRIPLPCRLLYNTDLFITMPVPKIHCMTGVSLAFKNQWGCIPDIMRLRRHYLFSHAIVEINRLLKPWVIADGTYFLDNNGPMEGKSVKMDLVIAANNPGAFDRYVTELMGISWEQIEHLKVAAKLGELPKSLSEIEFNGSPGESKRHDFQLHRTLRNWISLAGFKSRTVTWLGYESWVGKEILHRLLYAVAGKPVKPKPE